MKLLEKFEKFRANIICKKRSMGVIHLCTKLKSFLFIILTDLYIFKLFHTKTRNYNVHRNVSTLQRT